MYARPSGRDSRNSGSSATTTPSPGAASLRFTVNRYDDSISSPSSQRSPCNVNNIRVRSRHVAVSSPALNALLTAEFSTRAAGLSVSGIIPRTSSDRFRKSSCSGLPVADPSIWLKSWPKTA
ncbi:MAG TPA: hypothetical protein DCY80_03905 [Solibacterales bacterium]|nr:hypothetical protein [Bryobacterales bacterium]